jgi:hypothetical protein
MSVRQKGGKLIESPREFFAEAVTQHRAGEREAGLADILFFRHGRTSTFQLGRLRVDHRLL